MNEQTLTLADLTAYLAANSDQKEALLSYREAAKATLAYQAADRRRQGLRSKANVRHWTTVLYSDFMAAGPNYVEGFRRAEWPPLQVLRNHGIAFSDSFVNLIDVALDGGGQGRQVE